MIDPIAEIEALAVDDVDRGMEQLAPAVRGDLAAAARALIGTGGRVGVVTGFFIPSACPPSPETDGPVGAAALAMALTALGTRVELITDERCEHVVRAAAVGYGLSDPRVIAVPDDAAPPDVMSPGAFDCLVYVERPGRATDGHYHSMRGDVLDGWTAPLDDLLPHAATTIGIGDGGNEVGMGRLPRDLVEKTVEHGPTIASAVATDRLIVAGCSNWGAHALVAALALLGDRAAVSPALDPVRHHASLVAAVGAGAVDGVSRRSEPTVDGLGWPRHERVLTAVNSIVDAAVAA